MSAQDAIIIGAGSVGMPTAYFLAREGFRVTVIDRFSSSGQGQNKSAIGGVRATHSDHAKRNLAIESLRIFSSWKNETGWEIGWKRGGYCFPAYREKEEETLKNLFPPDFKARFNLDVGWVGPERIQQVVPGINPENLRGGIYSPNDGQVSPLLFDTAIYWEARKLGVEFRFKENVNSVLLAGDRVVGVETNTGEVHADIVVNAAGAKASQIAATAGLNIPIKPDSHEAGISSPIKEFLDPLVVDMRPGADGRSSNFYFGQNHEGAVIFCYTPSQLIPGVDRRSTSAFMPVIAKRLVEIIPRFKNLTIRRVWRGLYPMTPDGIPMVGESGAVEGFFQCVGMCGQGFMLGPGAGLNLAHMIAHRKPVMATEIFRTLSPDRDFAAAKTEALK